MDDQSFVAKSVSFQLGDVSQTRMLQNAETRKYAITASSGSLLAWNAEEQQPYDNNGWVIQGDTPDKIQNQNRFVNRDKAVNALVEILDAGADFDVLVDMQDRRVRELAVDGVVHPVFCFNRLAGAKGRILWPLPMYHNIGSEGFLGGLVWDRVNWKDKRPVVAWRGITGGRANPFGDARRDGIRLRPLMKKFERKEVTKTEVLETLMTFPRHRFIASYNKDPRFDVGFVDGGGTALNENSFLAHLEQEKIPRRNFQSYKYLAVLRGLDVGSSMFWTMNSGSLGLVMETPFETFASVHFRPWEHYVPFKEDLSDMDERLDWIRENDRFCQEMTQNAAEVCTYLARSDLRQKIQAEMIEELRPYL